MVPEIPFVASHLPVSDFEQAQLPSDSNKAEAVAEVITGHLYWQSTLFSRTNDVLFLLGTWRKALALETPTLEDETRANARGHISLRPNRRHCSMPTLGNC